MTLTLWPFKVYLYAIVSDKKNISYVSYKIMCLHKQRNVETPC